MAVGEQPGNYLRSVLLDVRLGELRDWPLLIVMLDGDDRTAEPCASTPTESDSRVPPTSESARLCLEPIFLRGTFVDDACVFNDSQ